MALDSTISVVSRALQLAGILFNPIHSTWTVEINNGARGIVKLLRRLAKRSLVNRRRVSIRLALSLEDDVGDGRIPYERTSFKKIEADYRNIR